MHEHAHTYQVCSIHPCSRDIPCIHTGTAPHTPQHPYIQTYTHLHTSMCTPICMYSIPIHSAHMYSYICMDITYTPHNTLHVGTHPTQVQTLTTRRTTHVNHTPPTPALNPLKALGLSGLEGAPPLTRGAPWAQRGLGATAGGRPALRTPSSRSPAQLGKDRATADTYS